MLFGLKRYGRYHITADAVTYQRQAFAVNANFITVLGYPAGCGISLINCNWEMRFRGGCVVNKNGHRFGCIYEVANQTLMCREIAQDPAAAVEEHKYRQCSRRVMRLHNIQCYFLPINLNRFFTDVGRRQRYPFLRIDQHLTCCLSRQLLNGLPSASVQRIQELLNMTFWACCISKAVG